MERLQKVIANSGYCSRRKAEELINDRKVKVNGKFAVIGMQVSDKDEIEVEGNTIAKEDKVYFLLNKPRGVVTTAKDDKNRTTVVDLINTSKRIYPVGRLDYDTTGLLILTNDGELANLLTHPKSEIEKVYVAKVKGIVSYENIKKLSSGVYIDGIKTAKAKAKIIRFDKDKKTTIVELTIHEGKNHQVKKMFESLGYEVLKLKRERESFLDLQGLNVGEYRNLTPKEVKKLYGELNSKQN
ncbi:MAG: pseudouridine synthase [Bacilli bacterium]|nr:pseudouridine synthase [Bacilli bacterium]